MNERGVIYMAWGQNAIDQAKQSIFSLRKFLPNIPVMVVGDTDAFEDDPTIKFQMCSVDPFDENQKKGFKFMAGRIKPLLAAISPFEKTLYVDADTYFQRPPDEGFDLLDRWDVALAETQSRALADGITGKDECQATVEEFGTGLLLYHNSGMIFWRRNEKTKALFEHWQKEWMRYQGWDEQVALLRALLKSDVLFLTLPHTWNHSVYRECYMLSHWFGAGDARFDRLQRARVLSGNIPKKKASSLMRFEIRPGQWVQCRPEDIDKVREMYGINNQSIQKEVMKMNGKGPLVKVMRRPGQYVKMYLKDAEKLGLAFEPERKARAQKNNKMIEPAGNKAVIPEAQWEDFTAISGIGPATNKALHENGIHTFEDLLVGDVSFLTGTAKKAVEAWQENVS